MVVNGRRCDGCARIPCARSQGLALAVRPSPRRGLKVIAMHTVSGTRGCPLEADRDPLPLCERGLRAMHGRHPYGRRDRRQRLAPPCRLTALRPSSARYVRAFPPGTGQAGAQGQLNGNARSGAKGRSDLHRRAGQRRNLDGFAASGGSRSFARPAGGAASTASGSTGTPRMARQPVGFGLNTQATQGRHYEVSRLVLDAPGCQLARLEARRGCDRRRRNTSPNFANTAPIPGIAPERRGLTAFKATSPSAAGAMQSFRAYLIGAPP